MILEFLVEDLGENSPDFEQAGKLAVVVVLVALASVGEVGLVVVA